VGHQLHLKATLPSRQGHDPDTHVNAQCWDLSAYISPDDDPMVKWVAHGTNEYTILNIPPKQRVVVHTGLMIQFPPHMGAVIRPRSGLAARHGIMVLGGEIDPAYRGEIMVVLYNSDDKEFTISHGMRVAQMRLVLCWDALRSNSLFTETTMMDVTERGEHGFGSSGL
jgi:dUTP pyrophosphatase